MFQERLRQIGPEEFVQAFAKEEKTSKKTVFCDMKRTSNLEAYVQWFNRLSYLVASEICSVSNLFCCAGYLNFKGQNMTAANDNIRDFLNNWQPADDSQEMEVQ